jgi:hypothetical protein
MPDGRLWLIRDSYAAETAWAPHHIGKELRLSRLGAFDAGLGAIRADAEADIARKAGDHIRAERHETLAASYRALHDLYQQREQTLARAIADRQEWEHATEQSLHLAIAADSELRRRHPDRKIEPLRSAAPTPAGATERERLYVASHQDLGETTAWIRNLTAQHQAFRAKIKERRRSLVPNAELGWADLSEAFPTWYSPSRKAILQPPKPQIAPSTKILWLSREKDLEWEAGD